MLKTCASLFTGGGGWDTGAIASGLTPLWGIEYDKNIAGVYRMNYGDHVIVDGVQNVDPHKLEAPDVLFISQPCPNFSNAKANAQETENDLLMARSSANFIRVLKPSVVMVENVPAFAKSLSVLSVYYTLLEQGYKVEAKIVNCADYGVPQTRTRLIVIGVAQGAPAWEFPEATHAENPIQTLWGMKEKWIGWYEAIEDLIPGLPESQFAEWQLKRLPAIYKSVLTDARNSRSMGGNITVCDEEDPAFTLVASSGVGRYRAFIVPGINPDSNAIIDEADPANTVLASADRQPTRAFIMDSKANKNQETVTVRDGENPIFTIPASLQNQARLRAFIANQDSRSGVREDSEPLFTLTTEGNRAAIKAFLVEGTNAGRETTVRQEDEPSYTLGAQNKGAHRAFIMDSANSANKQSIRFEEEPALTVETFKKSVKPRAWLAQGKVVQMTPRALARFQSFPDSYKLPESKALACKVIGNAVPPRLAQVLVSYFVELLKNSRAA